MQPLGMWEWNDDFGLVQDLIDPNRFWAREEVPPELVTSLLLAFLFFPCICSYFFRFPFRLHSEQVP